MPKETNTTEQEVQTETETTQETSNQQSETTQTESEFDYSSFTRESMYEEEATDLPEEKTESLSEEVEEKTEISTEEAETETEVEATTEESLPEETTEKEEKAEVETEAEEPEEKVTMPTREELTGMYKTHREETIPQLEKLFQLSEEEVQQFQDNPEKILPKFAAQIQYDAMMSAYNGVMAALPSVVGRMQNVSKEVTEAENEFFTTWPQLKDPKYAVTTQQAIRAYRQANPKANKNEVIQKAGILAMMQAGIEMKKEEPKKKVQTKTPPPPVGAGASSQPFPAERKSQQEDNLFADLTNAFQDEFN